MTTESTPAVQSTLTDERTLEPRATFAALANISDPTVYDQANADREACWIEWVNLLDWFGGGKLNSPTKLYKSPLFLTHLCSIALLGERSGRFATGVNQ
ncbi:MAG: hypothetical protein H8F28_23030 [Fibrella sp.]|nr:hypothetical protein [Armatimonadota bacterium]